MSEHIVLAMENYNLKAENKMLRDRQNKSQVWLKCFTTILSTRKRIGIISIEDSAQSADEAFKQYYNRFIK